MQIFIQLLSGEAFTLEVEGSTTIESIKAKIQHVEETLIKDQCLFFRGVQLQDGILSDYNIDKGSTLDLVPPLQKGMHIPIRLVSIDTTIFQLKVNPVGTVGNFKAKLCKVLKTPVCDQHLFIFDGETMHMLKNERLLSNYNFQKVSTIYHCPV